MAEGARLESVYTFVAYRGFESLSLRQIQKNRPCGGFFVCDGRVSKSLCAGYQRLRPCDDFIYFFVLSDV